MIVRKAILAALTIAACGMRQDVSGLALAAEIQAGDWVVTVNNTVPVRVEKVTRFVLAEGTELVAGEINDEWVAVTVLKEGQKARGWVQRKHLAPMGYEPGVRAKLVGELSALPAEKQYIAFSLNAARKRLQTASGFGAAFRALVSPNSPNADPEVAYLGGITYVRGLVVDPKSGDAILVGQYIPGRQRLALDDLVVALRARFVHGQWPVVSIDPPATRREPAYHNVRFEGGVCDTAFGLTLFEADYLLKKVGQGHVATGVPEVPSEWELWLEQAQTQYGRTEVNIGGRVWFFPILGATPVRENVAAYSGLKVGVFYEVLSASIGGRRVQDLTEIKSPTGEQFVILIRQHYEPLAAMHPSWRRIQQLNELVALTRAIEVMEHRPDLNWWLESYRVTPVETPRQAKELSRSRNFNRRSYSYTVSVEGGVELRAMALRLEAGDVSALADAALSTRPAPDALTWGFVADEWLIAIPPDKDIKKGDEVTPQFVYAQFLTRQGKYEEALARLDKILSIEPNYLDAFLFKGTLLSDQLKRPEDAIECFDALLQELPESTEALVGRGLARAKTNNFFQAIEDFDKALQINPKLTDALAYRGVCRGEQGEYHEAISDLTAALRLVPAEAIVYMWRGNLYRVMADQMPASAPVDEAAPELPDEPAPPLPPMEAAPAAPSGPLAPAPPDAPPPPPPAPDTPPSATPGSVLPKPVDVAPPPPPVPTDPQARDSEQHAMRESLHDKALADFDEAIRRNPNLAFAYASRGRLYQARQQTDKAIADLSEAIRLEPSDLSYYATRAAICDELGKYAEAIADYTAILAQDSSQTEARWRRSEAYRKSRQFQKALDDCTKLNLLLFVEIATQSAPLKDRRKDVGTVYQGEEVKVMQTNGDWLWVEAVLSSGKVLQGWIDQKHVR